MTFDTGVVTASAVFAAVACVLNFRAACYGPFGLRTINGIRGALAGLYVLSYVWLLFHLEQRAMWSRNMTGVSLFTWCAVWILPAVVALRLERKAKQASNGLRK